MRSLFPKNVSQPRLVVSFLIGSLLFCGKRRCLQSHARRVWRHPLQTDPQTRERHQVAGKGRDQDKDKGKDRDEDKGRDQVEKKGAGKVEDSKIGDLEV